jgi:hypothetical protein
MRIRHTVWAAGLAFFAASKVLAQESAQGSGTGYERELRDWARREVASLRACYDHVAATTPDASRAVQNVTVAIGPDGAVTHVAVHGRASVATPLETCINPIATTWRLSRARSGPVLVTLGRDQLRSGYAWIRAH